MNSAHSSQTHQVVVIGAGQAGLSVTKALHQHGIRPLVLEKNRIGHSWDQERWDSFCLVTPNWQCQLPDFPYDGDQPEGFMDKKSIVAFLQRFARAVDGDVRGRGRAAPVWNGSGYRLLTSEGEVKAQQVVVATGGYHTPRRHPLAERLTASMVQLDARDYRNAESLPAGPVLVVGGQSGSQIAEDLFLSGRKVHLSVGGAPARPGLPRAGCGGLAGSHGVLRHADQRARRSTQRATKTNHYLTGRDGGREIDLRRRAVEGLHLHGRLSMISRDRIQFASDLSHNLDQADAVYCRIRSSIDSWIEKQGIDAPSEAAPLAGSHRRERIRA